MYKTIEYMHFSNITLKVMELEQLNRRIDIDKLKKLSIVKNERLKEFIATNNIEGDNISFSVAKQFLRTSEALAQSELERRWIGIKFASDEIWKDSFYLDVENMFVVHRALMSRINLAGGIYKQKINQVGTLITTHPEDVPNEMFNMLSTFNMAYVNENSIYQIIPFLSEFLAIHPFEDGNGRMSRLITSRLAYDAGYKFTKYISLSKYLWDNKQEYISALESRNKAWGRKELTPQDLIPLFEVILDSLISAAKKALEYLSLKKYSKQEFSETLKLILVKELSFSEIVSFLKPSNSDNSLKSWIKELILSNEIGRVGSLRTTKYFGIKQNK